ncbi:hypothetical protein [Motiliproteus sp. SC1-56]|uniref:hypothetical protein n=1 Tax=Motiliproteus sp. SC1-56 TaxID=2799565 RepID=UPI001A8DA099|nr:hypothetical protein [Motiliproteus sp. SC1-56]
MAGKQDAEEREGGELTPEQRIEKLEKGRTLNLILICVLGFFSLLQLGAIAAMFLTSGDQRPDRNADAIANLEHRIERLRDSSQSIEGFRLEAGVLNDKLDRVLNQTDLNNFAVLRALMIEREEDHTRFIEALQQGMYDLSRMLRGSRTWYEVYKEDLDRVLQNSRNRLVELKGMTPVEEGNAPIPTTAG